MNQSDENGNIATNDAAIVDRPNDVVDRELAAVADAVVNLSAANQQKIVTAAVSNLSTEDQQKVVADAVTNLSTENQQKVVAETVSNVPLVDQQRVVTAAVSNLSTEDLQKVVAAAVTSLSTENQQRVVAETVNNLSSDEKQRVVRETASGLSFDDRRRLANQLMPTTMADVVIVLGAILGAILTLNSMISNASYLLTMALGAALFLVGLFLFLWMHRKVLLSMPVAGIAVILIAFWAWHLDDSTIDAALNSISQNNSVHADYSYAPGR